MPRSIEEEREAVALKIMGWHQVSGASWHHWADEQNHLKVPVSHWRPDERLDQAMQVLDAVARMPAKHRSTFIEALGRYPRTAYEPTLEWFLFTSDKPALIFHAAVAVAEAMEEKSNG